MLYIVLYIFVPDGFASILELVLNKNQIHILLFQACLVLQKLYFENPKDYRLIDLLDNNLMVKDAILMAYLLTIN